ncbi:MAG: hypothetical protein IT445_20065 [Phycisphaeraceae bacterium]|nr:hypothetical protein [Phycisphaeraceae bacterium]
MTKTQAILLFLIATLWIAGCVPKRVSWSPDGSQAAIIGEKGLYLCDADGKLSSLLAPGVSAAEWFSDGKRLAAVQETEVDQWDEIAAALTETQRDALVEIARQLSADLQSADQWNDRINKLKERDLVSPNEVAAIKLYLRDTEAPNVPAEVLADPSKVTLHAVRIGEATDDKIALDTAVWTGLNQVFGLRIASHDKAMILTTGNPFGQDNEQRIVELWLIAPDQQPQAQVLEKSTALYPDWTADGTNVVYCKPAENMDAGNNTLVSLLVSRAVCDTEGQLLAENAQVKELAGLMMSDLTRVCCLRDGRILFNSNEVQLPTTPDDVNEKNLLFSINPGKRATVARLVPRSQESNLGDAMWTFAVSPDEKHVAFLGEKGRVLVMDIADGNVRSVQTKEDSDAGRTQPVWRNADELCFTEPVPDDQKVEGGPKSRLVLLNVTTEEDRRSLSDKWPAEVVEGLLN